MYVWYNMYICPLFILFCFSINIFPLVRLVPLGCTVYVTRQNTGVRPNRGLRSGGGQYGAHLYISDRIEEAPGIFLLVLPEFTKKVKCRQQLYFLSRIKKGMKHNAIYVSLLPLTTSSLSLFPHTPYISTFLLPSVTIQTCWYLSHCTQYKLLSTVYCTDCILYSTKYNSCYDLWCYQLNRHRQIY